MNCFAFCSSLLKCYSVHTHRSLLSPLIIISYNADAQEKKKKSTMPDSSMKNALMSFVVENPWQLQEIQKQRHICRFLPDTMCTVTCCGEVCQGTGPVLFREMGLVKMIQFGSSLLMIRKMPGLSPRMSITNVCSVHAWLNGHRIGRLRGSWA